MNYDVIVIGGGHAGIEASLSPVRMGVKTLLVTILAEQIGASSCNPAVGGLAKGHLVKELDAMGGQMVKRGRGYFYTQFYSFRNIFLHYIIKNIRVE